MRNIQGSPYINGDSYYCANGSPSPTPHPIHAAPVTGFALGVGQICLQIQVLPLSVKYLNEGYNTSGLLKEYVVSQKVQVGLDSK